jgi:hypothetical protein
MGCFPGILEAPIRDIDYSWDRRYDYRHIYQENKDIATEKSLYDSMQLMEADVGALYRIFNRVDKDHSGSIEVVELLMYLDIERTPFSMR